MEHLVPVLVFYLLVLTLCLARPGAGRIFVGIFFLIMAIGINVVLVFVAPELFVGIGTDAPLIPLYRWFALMMLSKGRYAKWGIIGGIVLLIGISRLGCGRWQT